MRRFDTEAKDEALKEIFKPISSPSQRKQDLLEQLGKLSEDELASLVESIQQQKAK